MPGVARKMFENVAFSGAEELTAMHFLKIQYLTIMASATVIVRGSVNSSLNNIIIRSTKF